MPHATPTLPAETLATPRARAPRKADGRVQKEPQAPLAAPPPLLLTPCSCVQEEEVSTLARSLHIRGFWV